VGSVLAQSPDVVLAVEDGTRTLTIARRVAGQWMNAEACEEPSAASESTGPMRVAATGGHTVNLVRGVRPGSDEWRALAPTVLRLFDQREGDARLAPNQTSVALKVVDWIYSVDVRGVRQYYFEASRRVSSVTADVGLDTDPPGTSRVAVSGFLRQDPDGLTSLGLKSEMHWKEDGLPAGPPGPDLTPLGVVVDGERSIWVMQGRSGAHEWFALFDVGQRGVRPLVNTRTDCAR